MASTAFRGGVGDASAFWAELCGRFTRLRVEAVHCGLGSRCQGLVDAARRGEARVEDWVELTAEIAELHDEAADYTSRRGEFAVTARVETEIAVSGGFGCPGGLCDRRLVAHALGPTPRCELLNRDMRTLGA
jgi:hypothetical protein